MRHGIARTISIVAHPFVTALVLTAVLASSSGTAALRTAAAVAVLFVLPVAILTVRQVRRGTWSTVDASEPRDRKILFAVGAGGLFALLAYFARTQPGSAFVHGTFGVLVMVAVCAAITPWVKVSLHMAAAALAAAVLLGRGHPLGWLLAAILPVLAWSRLELRRHQLREVILGTALGACTGAAIALFG